jgi:S1-C subfamily serine protease
MMTVLSSFSDDLAAIVERAAPTVARIDARRAIGSGTIWSPEGILVTAAHVVEREDRVEVGLFDGRTLPATLVGRDPTTDVAVLRVQATGLTPPAWAGPDGLRVGQLILALARPGRTLRATLGILSAAGDAWRTRAGGQIDRYLQADVRVWPGFSGGPLIDVSGSALGLNTAAMRRGPSLTIPATTLRRVVDALLAYGRVRRGYLGVGAHPVRLPAGPAQQLGQELGLLLVSVEPGSPAERGGLFLGDVIVAVAGQAVRRPDDLMAMLTGDQVGSTVPVRIVRGGQVQDLNITVGERAA